MNKYRTAETEWFTILEHDFKVAETVEKDNVYLSAHPEDADFLRDLGAFILSVFPGCRIYISKGKEGEIRPEQFSALLKRTKLFVFAVSEKFLTRENSSVNLLRTIERDYKTRILPVQISPGIESLFNETIGSYHLINVQSPEFSERLKYYLDQTVNHYVNIDQPYLKSLVNEEIFPHRIFVSYRKKDREAMLEVIRMIRSWDDFFDTAIWYDRSLVYGEDFNTQINEKLHLADIVVFVVTPLLLEEGNYVHEYEYVQAVKEGKILVPVLMEEGCEQAVKDYYPEFKTLYQGEGFLNYLLEVTGKADGVQFDPNRLFLMYSAYEEGTLTEQDHALAMRILELSANHGSVTACAVLGNNYLKGINVPKNLQKAVRYLEYALDQSYRMMKSTDPAQPGADAIGRNVFNACNNLLEYHISNNDAAAADSLIYALYESVLYLDKTGYRTTTINVGYVLMKTAQIKTLEGNIQEALKLIRSAEDEFLQWDRALGMNKTKYYLAFLYHHEGSLHLQLYRQGNLGELVPAFKSLEKAFEGFAQLAVTADDPARMRDLSAAVNAYEETAELFYLRSGGGQVQDHIYKNILGRLGTLMQMEYDPSVAWAYAKALAHCAYLDPRQGQQMLDTAVNMMNTAAGCAHVQGEEAKRDYERVLEAAACWPEPVPGIPWLLSSQTAVRKTRWNLLDPRDTAYFTDYETLPEGEWGKINGSYIVSGYVCPHCGKRLYKTTIPGERTETICIGDTGENRIHIVRMFASPCGLFFASPMGYRVTDGIVAAAQFNPEYSKTRNREWLELLEYFNELGEPGAKRDC